MKQRISILDFNFKYAGHGHYIVSYTSPKTGKSWTRLITDMELIDVTKNAEDPKVKDLEYLKYYCKN